MPSKPAEPKEPATEPRAGFLEEKTFKSRTVLLFGAINDTVAAQIARQLLALAAESGGYAIKGAKTTRH